MHGWRHWTKLDSVIGIFAVALTIIGIMSAVAAGARRLFPARYWYELKAVYVEPRTIMGDVVKVWPTRTIHRNFDGRYVIRISRIGSTAPICAGGVNVPYRAMPHADQRAAQFVQAVSLDW